MHVPTGVSLTDPIEFPDQRHKRVSRTRQAGVYSLQVNIRQVRFARNLLGGARRDDTQVRLRQGQRCFYIEPGLEARFFGEQRTYARVGNTE